MIPKKAFEKEKRWNEMNSTHKAILQDNKILWKRQQK